MRNIVHIFLLVGLAAVVMARQAFGQGQRENPLPGKVLAEDGAWGYAGKHAYIYRNALFYSYLDSKGRTWVASYTVGTGIIRTSIWQGDANLHSANPLVIRPDGRIQVFLDKGPYFDRKIRWKTSKQPGDISAFTPVQESTLEGTMLQGRQFYPLTHRPTGWVFLVTNARAENGDRYTVMWKSTDGGNSFEQYENLWVLGKDLKNNRSYTRAFLQGDEIHFTSARVGWGEAIGDHDVGRVEGVYYVKYNVLDDTFYSAGGKAAFSLEDVPVSDVGRFDEVWHWERDGKKKQRALWCDIVADSTGKPYIAFALMNAVERGDRAEHAGCWAAPDEAGGWNFHAVSPLARGWNDLPERKNYAIAVDPLDPYSVFISRALSGQGSISQVTKMRTPDSGASWAITEVYSGEGRHSTVVIPQVVDNSLRFPEVIWLEGRLADWEDYRTKIVTTVGE